jgi:hypothetical protein
VKFRIRPVVVTTAKDVYPVVRVAEVGEVPDYYTVYEVDSDGLEDAIADYPTHQECVDYVARLVK